MAKQKFPLQWILAFSLTPVVTIVFVLYLLYGGGEAASKEKQADVKRVVRIYPSLKVEHAKAMSDGKLTVNEANSIVKKANALTTKNKR